MPLQVCPEIFLIEPHPLGEICRQIGCKVAPGSILLAKNRFGCGHDTYLMTGEGTGMHHARTLRPAARQHIVPGMCGIFRKLVAKPASCSVVSRNAVFRPQRCTLAWWSA